MAIKNRLHKLEEIASKYEEFTISKVIVHTADGEFEYDSDEEARKDFPWLGDPTRSISIFVREDDNE